MTDLYQVSSR